MANSKLKLLYILELLYNESDEDHPIDTERIQLYLRNHNIEAERKSIYSDITVLKEFGFDVLLNKGASGGYFLASREFEVAEIRLLCDAVQAAGFISPKKSRHLIDKILTLVSAPQAQQIKSQVYVDNRPKSANEEIYYHIDKLNRAIQNGWQVQALYRRRKITDQNAVEYDDRLHTVSPYAMIWADDHYYLVCNKAKYDNLMVLRIDRIKKLEILENERARHFSEVSPYKNSFDSADYAKRHLHMFSGTPEGVELICQNDLLEQVLDRFGEDVRLYRAGEDKFGLRTQAAVNDGLVAWIMQFGAKVRVKKPDNLKKLLFEKAREIESVYKI